MPEDKGQHGKPGEGRERQINPVQHLNLYRCFNVDDYREQRQKEQGRLGIQAISQEAHNEGSSRCNRNLALFFVYGSIMSERLPNRLYSYI